jgi:hypothetical protein
VKISLFITEFRVRDVVLLHHSRAKGKIGVLCSLGRDNAEPTRNLLPACINGQKLTSGGVYGRGAVAPTEIQYAWKDMGDKPHKGKKKFVSRKCKRRTIK